MVNGESGLEALLARLAGELAGTQSPAIEPAADGGADDSVAAFTAAAEQLRSVEQVQGDAVAPEASSSGGSGLDTAGSVAASVFENRLGLSPLISGLVSLFSGGDSTAPPALNTYTAPESVQFEGDVYRSADTTDWGGSGGMDTGTAVPQNTQITVQVTAMDSQSFLDHSQDIANAVRQAMLNSNSLNDVVNDL